MATEILLPRLGWTMEEGIFGEWLVQDGALVREGDLIFTMEGDKATQEIEALEAGILRIPSGGPKTGDLLPVGALLGYLLAEGEELPGGGAVFSESVISESVISASVDGASVDGALVRGGVTHSADGVSASPRARRVAGELGIDWRSVAGSGRTGRIVERDVRAAYAQIQVAPFVAAEAGVPEIVGPEKVAPKATPVAQRVARGAGIDLVDVAPTGTGGRIQRQDVENEVARRSESTVRATSPTQVGTRQPHSRTRKIIAQRMVQSRQSTAPVTLNTEVDATALVALRAQIKAAYAKRGQIAPSYNDLLVKLVSVALREHPALNATWDDEGLTLWQASNIGLAVDTEGGLLVPVIQDAGNKTVAQIAEASRELITRAQGGKATAADLQGGTFTISNLGMYGIDAFTPVINLPEAAILGVGRIVEKAVVRAGAMVVRSMLTLSLTFDHRVVDGAPAARFLKLVGEYVEDPTLWTFE